MANFDEIARMAREKSQAIVDADEHAKKIKKDAEVERLGKAEEVLREHVLPVLQDAKASFEKDGITLSISDGEAFRLISHDGKTIKIRQVIFGCSSKLEKSRHGFKQAKGQQFAIEHDGDTIVGKVYGTQGSGQRFSSGTFPAFVAPLVEQALETYYADLRKKS